MSWRGFYGSGNRQKLVEGKLRATRWMESDHGSILLVTGDTKEPKLVVFNIHYDEGYATNFAKLPGTALSEFQNFSATPTSGS